MAETRPVVMVTSGGGVPTIPPRVLGKPGLQECASEVTGPLYDYLPQSFTPSAIAEGHNTKGKSQKKLEAAMREVHRNEPSTVARADVSAARKEKMRQAIAFSKARKRGAKV